MNNYKKLVNNSLVFAVGNLGTKLLVIFLVPLYTYYLTTSEFGVVDLLTTTTSLLVPLFTLSIFDSVFRFVMDKDYDRQSVLINALIVILSGFVLLCLLYPVMLLILPFDDYLPYLYLLLLAQSVYSTVSQYIRAEGRVKLFAFIGIFNAFVLLTCNIVFLVLLQWGIVGYLQSLIISFLMSILISLSTGKVYKDLNFKKMNFNIMREMLRYSIPLMPNSLMWWVMGFSDRYIITYFIGLSANGLYAVASKIPSILNIINSIFFQAWQMSAIEEQNSENKSKFFSKVFNVFSILMLMSASLILMHLKILVNLFIADTFYEAWKYVPFLLLGVVFSSFSSFFGINYIVAKKTSAVFKTSIIGAATNIITNLVLIPLIGVNGAAIGTMVSFAAIWFIRFKDAKQFVRIEFYVNKFFLTLIIIFLQVGVLYQNTEFEYLIQMCLFAILILVNCREISSLVMRVKGS